MQKFVPLNSFMCDISWTCFLVLKMSEWFLAEATFKRFFSCVSHFTHVFLGGGVTRWRMVSYFVLWDFYPVWIISCLFFSTGVANKLLQLLGSSFLCDISFFSWGVINKLLQSLGSSFMSDISFFSPGVTNKLYAVTRFSCYVSRFM